MPTPITTLAKAPELSLAVRMEVTRGRKNIMRQVGVYQTRFLNGSINEFVLELVAGASKELGATHGLTLFTDSKIRLTLTKGGVVSELEVNRMFFSDDVFEDVVITNATLETANIQVVQHSQ